MNAKDIYEAIKGRRPSMEVVPADKVNESSFYADTRGVSDICERLHEESAKGIQDSVLLSLLTQDGAAPLLLKHSDGTYTAVTGHNQIEAYKIMDLPTFNAAVVFPPLYTEMRKVEEAELPWPSPREGWNVLFRYSGDVDSVVIAKTDRKGRVTAMTGHFAVGDRNYVLAPADGGLNILPNTEASLLRNDRRRQDLRKIALVLDAPQLKGRVVEEMKDILDY